MNQFTINLTMGDVSGDGHRMCQTHTILSNLNYEMIQEAYNKGTEIVGFDLVNDCCQEYEEDTLSLEVWQKLSKVGYEHNIKTEEEAEEETLWYDEFVQIYLFIVKLGNPNFECERPIISDIDIGGYGIERC